MISKLSAILLLTVVSSHCLAQSLFLVDSIETPEAVYVSKDQSGNIYLADVKGKIIRYSRDLTDILIYSPDRPARVTSMETWQGMRVFCFFKDIQEYTLLNRFLDGPNNYDLNNHAIIFVSAATLSYDNNLWLFDQPGLKLVKFNTAGRSIEFHKPLDLILKQPLENIIALREYQNNIYLVDKKAGMYIFDNLGNYKLRVDIPEANWVGFYDNSVYFYHEEALQFQNLYNQRIVKMELPIRNPDFVVKTRFGIYVFKNEMLYRFEEK